VVDANGNIVCAPGAVNSPIATLSSTCSPINPFGQQISQAASDYVTTIARPVSINTQKVLTATVAGDVIDLPGGKIGISAGYEHREEKATFDPGAFFFGEVDSADPTGPRGQFGRSIPIDPVSGKFKTDEVFGEVRIPIVDSDMNVPLVYSLEVQGAVRYVHNSIAGNATTWTAGGQYRPIQDITLRGNYTRSIRAPAITELFAPTGLIFDTADDPCDARFLDAGPDPARRRANCAADGLPPDFQSLIVDRTVQESLSGNPNLENETAKSWTIGAVIRPSFVRGFAASVDWVNISLSKAILSLDDDQLLEACYDAANFPSEACSQIDRDPDGQIDFIRTGYVNAASYKYKGLIGQIDYQMPTPFLGSSSTVAWGVNYQYIDQLEQRVGTGDLTTLRSSIGYSKHKATVNLTYHNEAFTWQWQALYYGPAKFDPDELPDTRDYPGVSSVTFFNTTVALDVNDRFGLRFIVDNVFDKAPPFPSPGGGGSITYFRGLLGRYFKVGANVKF
ncbi:MAG: TonB-dependent receptor, partial [Planctomycetota bacterium]